MENEVLGDYPHVPEELIQSQRIEDELELDAPKRDAKFKSIRHRVKELLKDIIK